jgi:hypothetical protein
MKDARKPMFVAESAKLHKQVKESSGLRANMIPHLSHRNP